VNIGETMKETTLGSWNQRATPKKDLNIFQIWEAIGKEVPFAVRRNNWANQFYTIVEKVEIKKWPYGNAYGYPTVNGRYSNHYVYDKSWKTKGLIPCAGCYQWTLVEGVTISKNFSVLNTAQPLERTQDIPRPVITEKPRGHTFNELRILYPKAYAKWSPEDDEKLKNLFQSGKTTEELALIFQRKIGAIDSRLLKLGLKPETN